MKVPISTEWCPDYVDPEKDPLVAEIKGTCLYLSLEHKRYYLLQCTGKFQLRAYYQPYETVLWYIQNNELKEGE